MTFETKVPAVSPMLDAIVRDMERHLKSGKTEPMPALAVLMDLSEDRTEVKSLDYKNVTGFLSNPLGEMIFHSILAKSVSGQEGVPTNAYLYCHEAWASKRSLLNPNLGLSLEDDPDKQDILRVEVAAVGGIRENFIFIIDREAKTLTLSDVKTAIEVPIGGFGASTKPRSVWESDTIH